MHTLTLNFDTTEQFLSFAARMSASAAPEPAPAPTFTFAPVGEQIPAVPVNSASIPVSNFQTIMGMLNDSKWEYRKLSSLANAVNMSEDEVLDLLRKEDVDFRTARQRGTGAILVSLD